MTKISLRPGIVLFGDSITQFSFGAGSKPGWGAMLASAYQRRADVIKRGYSGYNTSQAVDLVPKIFGKGAAFDRILFCTVFFGANDATLPGEPQHVPIDDYRSNLRRVIEQIRDRTDNDPFPLILMTPPPIDKDAWKEYLNLPYYPRTNERAREYGLVVKDIAASTDNCFCVDTWEALGGDGPTEQYASHLCDGLHLSGSGNRLVYEALMALVKKELPDIAPLEADDNGDGSSKPRGIPEDGTNWMDFYDNVKR